MPDCLLKGLREIHENLFIGVDGMPVISFSTFRQQRVVYEGKKITVIEDLKRLGLIRELTIGKGKERTKYLCGWKNEIKNYYILKNQEEYKKENGE